MEQTNRLTELYHYLQDPHLVARFQRFCGVSGTFKRTIHTSTTTTTGSSKEEDRTHTHNNGACHHHLAGGNERSEDSAIRGAGEGEKVHTTAASLRKRIVDVNAVNNHREESENIHQNGALLSAATAGGETVGVGNSGNGRSFIVAAGATDAGATDVGEMEKIRSLIGAAGATVAGETEEKMSSTVKPLRKNSLTGEIGQEFIIKSRLLYYMFTFGTELGNELFYITFFPFIMWNVDVFVARRLVMVWVWVMYLGQCTKDVIGWSRPASPPVVKVEMFYNSEYSMPSTHAMSGTAIPFSLFIMTYGRWEYPFTLGFSLALCWCLLVCVSRIYMGMHSVLDVIAGFLYSVLILSFFLPALDLIDGFNQTCSYAPLSIISLHVGLGLFSFTLDTWSTSRGDTAQILGTGAGVALASHVNHRLGLMPDLTPEQLPVTMPTLSAALVGVAMLRFVLGVVALVATRALMKAVTIPLVCRVCGVPSDDVRKARQHMEVELPYRYIVYGTVGFNVLFLVPQLFDYMHLS
ncbi:sphingosine-1-phosphate phosphatase 1 [Scomber scombrus]|uniref:Sphingosine-1-phosphate phosphatase 1 n=1 Tax=Scomber scombrus TaxID=13677 RepID=A0AAV1PJY2_SCOSC|nr:sphingosine-1-phosphate phosphatase 1-like [Scomber scombrus]